MLMVRQWYQGITRSHQRNNMADALDNLGFEEAIKIIKDFYDRQDKLNAKLKGLRIIAEQTIFGSQINHQNRAEMNALFSSQGQFHILVILLGEGADKLDVARIQKIIEPLESQIAQDLPQITATNKAQIEARIKQIIQPTKTEQDIAQQIKDILTEFKVDTSQEGADDAILYMTLTLLRRQKALESASEIVGQIIATQEMAQKLKIKNLAEWTKAVAKIKNALRKSTGSLMTSQEYDELAKLSIDSLVNLKLLSKRQIILLLLKLELASKIYRQP